jgi:hypothetical protein
MQNVFILGLTDLQQEELETVPGAENYRFHDLLGYETLVERTDVPFETLLKQARDELHRFDGSIDAIVAHWDFPTSLLAPILADELGIPSPSLESLVKSEHKYWSRLEQRASVPECVPQFAAFDPFDDHALDSIDIAFPFWVKPVKAHSSSLGFEVHDEADFNAALREIRANIGDLGNAFNEVLRRLDLPPEIADAPGTTCLAEQLISGVQAAPEGTMFRGEFHVHGLFDMHKDAAGTSFERLDYPASSVPPEVQQRMIDLTERYLRRVGFDDGCFNSEFMWDRERDQLWLVEVNTRISQAHSDLFAKVDGASNHEVAIDIALGKRPEMPHRQGRFEVAAQCMIFHDEDAVVTRVPTEEELAEVERAFSGAKISVMVEPGQRLSEVPHQGSYRYIIAKAYIGAGSHDELLRRHTDLAEALRFEFRPADDKGAA